MDLTRFDFHALRFTKSDSVQSMTDAEIGQYIMLLCEAWLKAKDASLQNDPTYLARIAHCAEVSPKVMAQFHVVETQWGDRLRNDTLFEEWNRAILRSQKKRNAVEVRWENKRNTTVLHPYEKTDTSYIPKPNQAVPDQTEPESENMSMKNRINQSAGSKIVDQRNNAEFELLARKYGKEAVIADFEIWYGGTDGLLQWPGSAYLKIADSRLQSGAQSAIIQSDPRINEIVAFVYTVSQQAPRTADVATLLAENTQEEIQDAFKEYADGLDDFGLKNSARAFFKDGAGTGIILARRQKKIADDLQLRSEKASIEAGQAERKAAEDELLRKRREDDEAVERLGDMPF